MVTNDEILLKDRIHHLLNLKKVNFAMLADGNETLRARYGRQVNNMDTSVPYTTIHKLLTMFPDISADWLVMGEGSMRKADCVAPKVYHHNEVRDSSAGGSIHVGTTTIPYPVQALLDEKDKRINELEQDKQLLSSILSSMTKPK
jgi:hypothetical protein